MAVKTRRKYAGNAVQTTLSATLNSGATTTTLTAATGWPASGPFYAVVEPGTASEEKILIGTISGTSLSSITRGVDGTTETSHAIGSTIYPVFTAVDADEANELASTYANQGGIVYQGASTFAQLAIGTAGQVLKVNSGATAPEWGQVAAAGIASDAVTTAKILDANVTTAKIANDAVTAAKIADATLKLVCPVGTIVSYGGASAPTGWLLCNGDAIDGAYTELIALVGANTPDMKGRFPIGDNATLTLLGSGGSLTISSANLPTHTHTINHDHGSFNTSGSDGTHTHTYSGNVVEVGNHTHVEVANYSDVYIDPSVGINGFSNYYQTGSVEANTSAAGAHGHSYSGTTTTTGSGHAHAIDVPPLTGNSGDGGFVNSDYYPPYRVVNFIIKHDY